MAKLDLSIIEPYCENDMQLLKKISKSIFMRFREPLSEADYLDFYSVANMTYGRHTILIVMIWGLALISSYIPA